MNGLKYIRERCNMSLSCLAEKLGISRQAVSMWEQGKKQIPKKRLVELSSIFGIGEEYFDEISLEQKHIIAEKGLYFTEDNNVFNLSPTESDDLNINIIIDDDFNYLSEYRELQAKRKDLVKQIDNIIIGDNDKGSSIMDETLRMRRFIMFYNEFSEIVISLKGFEYSHSMFEVLKAFKLLLGLCCKDELIMTITETQHYSDEWSFNLSNLLKNHINEMIEEKHKRIQNALRHDDE